MNSFYLLNGSESLPIGKTTFKIGRAEFCDVCPNDMGVSRNHAELILNNGVLKVFDLESTNGTFVNGERVRERELQVGDVLTVAGTSYVIDTRPRGIWERLAVAAKAMMHHEIDKSLAARTYSSLHASV